MRPGLLANMVSVWLSICPGCSIELAGGGTGNGAGVGDGTAIGPTPGFPDDPEPPNGGVGRGGDSIGPEPRPKTGGGDSIGPEPRPRTGGPGGRGLFRESDIIERAQKF